MLNLQGVASAERASKRAWQVRVSALGQTCTRFADGTASLTVETSVMPRCFGTSAYKSMEANGLRPRSTTRSRVAALMRRCPCLPVIAPRLRVDHEGVHGLASGRGRRGVEELR